MRSIILAIALSCCATAASADQFVNGHVRRDGTYVQPHIRSAPNSNPFDNYSTRGNTNPYTGQTGTRDPFGSATTTTPSYDSYGAYGGRARTPCYGLGCR